MREIQWQLKETFTFPEFAGKPMDAESVKVTPRFTIDQTDDAVRLTGIYHIAANVTFEQDAKEAAETTASESAILIDDVEIETGYFEYAAPFNIDLPPEASDPLNMVTINAKHEIDEQGHFGVIWDVKCSYKEVVVIVEQEVEVIEAAKTEEVQEASVAIHESTSFNDNDEALSFIAGLEDGISTSLFRSNDVLVKSKS